MPSLSQKRVDERIRLGLLSPSEEDPHLDVHGVLLSDEITFYCSFCSLIAPFDPENLKPAAYELTLGDEYFISGEFCELDPEKGRDRIVIPPFEVAVLKTAETLCMPRYMIARWNIRVSHAYSGLLWVGGPQVDAGYVGHLFCPIYNLSDKAVTLSVGDPIAVIDFVKTTPFDSRKTAEELRRYPRAKRIILQDFGIERLQSALFTKAGVKITEFEGKLEGFVTRFITFTQITFALLALLISLTAASRIGVENVSIGVALTGAVTVAISIAALLIAILSRVDMQVARWITEQFGALAGERPEITRRFLRRSWRRGMWMSFAFAFAVGAALYAYLDPSYRAIWQDHVATKVELDQLDSTIAPKIDRLSDRIQRIEVNKSATLDDLDKLKFELEKEIAASHSQH